MGELEKHDRGGGHGHPAPLLAPVPGGGGGKLPAGIPACPPPPALRGHPGANGGYRAPSRGRRAPGAARATGPPARHRRHVLPCRPPYAGGDAHGQPSPRLARGWLRLGALGRQLRKKGGAAQPRARPSGLGVFPKGSQTRPALRK